MAFTDIENTYNADLAAAVQAERDRSAADLAAAATGVEQARQALAAAQSAIDAGIQALTPTPAA